jgi:hypothetical protein
MSSELIKQDNKLLQAVTNTNFEVLEQIYKGTLISPDDVTKLKEAQDFLLSTYTDVKPFRPMITKLAGVLSNGKFATPDAKFWQCKIEAEVHFNEMIRDIHKYERAKIDLEEIDYEIEHLQRSLELNRIKNNDSTKIEFQIRKLKVKKSEYEFEMKQIEKTIKGRIEEVTDWNTIAKKLAPVCQYSTTNSDYQEESYYKFLEYKIASVTDEKEKAQFQSQLDTFKQITGN